jgi:hypothetical protein
VSEKSFSNELERALSRLDAAELVRQMDVYHDHFRAGLPEWTDQTAADLGAIADASLDDPDKTFAYVMLAVSRYDDADFLGFVAAGPLENMLVDPSPEILKRTKAEARKTPRFRWMISIPFRHALAPRALAALQDLMIDGDNEPLPPAPWS